MAPRERGVPARRRRRHSQQGRRPGLARPDSGWWLVAVGAAFTAAELLFASPRTGLSWDEAVYVSQVSSHAPAAWFDPARARGVPLLVAPVAAVTGSVAALRVYLSLVCGLGLVLALWAWRPLRQAWVLALAGAAFGGLWAAQYYGPQAMPDMWSALGCLAAVGCFLRWACRRGGNGALAGLGASVAFVTLMRPGDAVFLAAPLLVAPLLATGAAVAARRRPAGAAAGIGRWELAAAVLAGLVAGGTEWVIEAYVRFGGVAARLHDAGAEQGGFGLHFALVDELRALNGPTLCRPCTVGIRDPELDLWWFALPMLVAVGIWGARRAGYLASSVLPAACGLCLAAQYLFLIGYAAPRFLLPSYALLAIPVADALAFGIKGVSWELRPAMAAVVACFLAAQLVMQHVVLDHEAGGTVRFHDDYSRIAAVLARRGVTPPCLVSGVQYIPIAFYAGCESAGGPAPGERVALLMQAGRHPPGYASHWRSYRITGTTVLHVSAYVSGR
ncbi:MAG: hypothetical protein JO132_19045 [Streptosporangiaceae bacterium]|nr:hypothetical protein [Streptosporangiaceae bacterium]